MGCTDSKPPTNHKAKAEQAQYKASLRAPKKRVQPAPEQPVQEERRDSHDAFCLDAVALAVESDTDDIDAAAASPFSSPTAASLRAHSLRSPHSLRRSKERDGTARGERLSSRRMSARKMSIGERRASMRKASFNTSQSGSMRRTSLHSAAGSMSMSMSTSTKYRDPVPDFAPVEYLGDADTLEGAFACLDAYRYPTAYAWFLDHLRDDDMLTASASVAAVRMLSGLRDEWALPATVSSHLDSGERRMLVEWLKPRVEESPACMAMLAYLDTSLCSAAAQRHPLSFYLYHNAVAKETRESTFPGTASQYTLAVLSLYDLAMKCKCYVGAMAARRVFKIFYKGKTSISKDPAKAHDMVCILVRFEKDPTALAKYRTLQDKLKKEVDGPGVATFASFS